MDPLISIRDLEVSFGRRRVLSGIDLDCRPGEITMLLGPSGSGKTTLLRAINRLNEMIAGCTTRGRILLRLEGQHVDIHERGVDLAQLRQKAGMVFQTPNVLPVSIARNFEIPLRQALRLTRAETRSRMEQALIEAELFDEVADRLSESALDLSGGQQQRLCLARALALQPAILLLDEPTASLDFRAESRIEALLTRLKHRYTILAVTHDLGQTCRLADRCAVLREGRICRSLGDGELRDEARLREVLTDSF